MPQRAGRLEWSDRPGSPSRLWDERAFAAPAHDSRPSARRELPKQA